MSRRLVALLPLVALLQIAPAVTGASPAYALACTPAVQQLTPPAVGTDTTFPAASAGSVILRRTGATALQIVFATPNPGWTPQIAVATGIKVKARFLGQGTTEIVRFVAYLNAGGTKLVVKVTDCP